MPFGQGHHLGEHPLAGGTIKWLPLNDGFLEIGTMIDPLSAVALLFVCVTISAIFLYSVGYHNFGQPKGDHDVPGDAPHGATIEEHGHKHEVPSVEPMYSRFFAFIGLFAFGMYTLVVSDNLLTLFVGWEIMGLCSYLLIGFWYAKPSAREAAKKAFMTTRVGDVFMLLGIGYLFSEVGSLRFTEVFTETNLQMLAEHPSGVLGLSAAALISLLLFIGTVGKSAQFPLHVWLPDAMEGPTPVSAMIHAATMVSAGVYMVIRMFPLISAQAHGGDAHGLTTAMTALAVIGSITALFSATIAVAQNDIKRVLAYSTISQLGFMVASLGIGAYVAAAFHLMTHAFFKALLFLGSGSVIHGMEHGVLHTGDHSVDPQDMMNMGGLRKKMPKTFWTFLIGGFALSGFPILTAGFWSKDEILADAWAHGHMAVFIILAVAAFLTAFYTMRQITLSFLGKPRTEAAEHASETVWTMTVPLMALAFFAVVSGWIGIPEHFPLLGGIVPNFLHHFLASVQGLPEMEAADFSWIPLGTSLFVALGGLGLGWLVYKDFKAGDTDPVKKLLGPVHTLLKNKYYFDEIYDWAFVEPAKLFSREIAYHFLDRKLIDGVLHTVSRVIFTIGNFLKNYIDGPIINGFGDLVGNGTNRFGHVIRVIQTGKVQQYMTAAALVIFALVVAVVFISF